jgi:crossover junction endodeoxyribonuclease RuvC
VRILGIDPGSRASGWGVVDVEGSRLACVRSGVIRPREAELAERLASIARDLETLIRETGPQGAAIETVFAARNARSALLLGQARGAALVACGLAGLPCAEYAPSQVKRAVVGHGAADKSQVQRMVQRLLGLERLPAQDEADALAVAVCHAHNRPRLAPATAAAHPVAPGAGR